jgi:hypothetical protein
MQGRPATWVTHSRTLSARPPQAVRQHAMLRASWSVQRREHCADVSCNRWGGSAGVYLRRAREQEAVPFLEER